MPCVTSLSGSKLHVLVELLLHGQVALASPSHAQHNPLRPVWHRDDCDAHSRRSARINKRTNFGQPAPAVNFRPSASAHHERSNQKGCRACSEAAGIDVRRVRWLAVAPARYRFRPAAQAKTAAKAAAGREQQQEAELGAGWTGLVRRRRPRLRALPAAARRNSSRFQRLSLLQHPQGVRCHNLGLGGRPRDALGVLQCAQRARSAGASSAPQPLSVGPLRASLRAAVLAAAPSGRTLS